MTSQLARYEEIARRMTTEKIRYALADVNATLQIWRDRPITDPYIEKLYAEKDAFVYELQRRGL